MLDQIIYEYWTLVHKPTGKQFGKKGYDFTISHFRPEHLFSTKGAARKGLTTFLSYGNNKDIDKNNWELVSVRIVLDRNYTQSEPI